MKKFLYILRKVLPLMILIGMCIFLAVDFKFTQNSYFGIVMIGVLVLFMLALKLYPKKNDYASNGERWTKKYSYVETSEKTKEKKDGTKEIIYTHQFKVECKALGITKPFSYDVYGEGGKQIILKDGKILSRKIDKNVYLRNPRVLE